MSGFYDRTGRGSVLRFSAETIERSAPSRFARLCAGVDRLTAAVVGIRAVRPQPHVWWPIGKHGRLCLRCSRMDTGGPPRVARRG